MIKIHWDGRELEECEGNAYHSLELFELIHEAPSYQSPVKERVVKEIVAGHYGNVTVYYINGKQEDVRVELTTSKHTAQDLRHAAWVFNNLAEALEAKE